MKVCIFCKSTHKSSNPHKCAVKSAIVNNSLKNIGKPEIISENPFMKVKENTEKPKITNIVYNEPLPKSYNENNKFRSEKNNDEDVFIDEDAYILYDVIGLLAKNQEFCEEIFSHICSNGCMLCTVNSHIEAGSFKKAQGIYNDICKLYGKKIVMIDFVNCLNIFLNCLHHLHIREFSDAECKLECIAHKVFLLDLSQEMICECDVMRKILLSLNTFTIPVNIFNSTTVPTREILFQNCGRTVPLCPSQKFCVRKNSHIITHISKANGWIFFELKYENPSSLVDLCLFEDIFIERLRAQYYLESIVFKENLKCHMFFRCYLGWECREKNLTLNSASELNLFFNVNRLKPCLVVYSTKT